MSVSVLQCKVGVLFEESVKLNNFEMKGLNSVILFHTFVLPQQFFIYTLKSCLVFVKVHRHSAVCARL